jgi:Septum formation
VSDQWDPPGPYPPPPPGQYPPPPPPPPGPAPTFPPPGGPHGRVVWPWVLGGLAVVVLVAAGVFVATRGDDDGSTATDSERDATTTESPSTTTTSEPSSTTTSEVASAGEAGVSLFPDELRVGDCFDDSGHGTSEVGEITRLECGTPHDGEVYALATLPGEPDGPYPGDDETGRLSDELCLDQFAAYVGVEYLDSHWAVGYYTPSEESWRKYDDRGVICYLMEPELGKIEGSQRGTGT